MAVTLVQLLHTMMQNKGSDLHVATNSIPMIRVRGDMLKAGSASLTAAEVAGMAGQITTETQRAELAKEFSIDFAFKAQGIGIFRVNIFQQRLGLSIVMRALTESPPTIEELKLPEICRTACNYANGLVLITGPTGSGKSTTLAAMINDINKTSPVHILTLEDPIEFQHVSQTALVSQRSMGQHFTTFASSLRAALREDPDVILVGEMRDTETMELAITAAETGHLVFSTLHTNSAAKTIDRIINSFPADEQPQIRTVLSETLKVVIAQKLIPSADKTRRYCFHDILVNTPAVANLIREGKTHQLLSVQQTGRREGMQVMDTAILEAVKRGEVSGEDGYAYANDKALFAQWAPKGTVAATESSAPTGTQTRTNVPAGTTKKTA
ncbi:MAG: type IV pilus twitching motility protein PilT [Oligoflexia bacterium]|nr:type IV pilus twitching motility protein PilT [Oligoflexia bacterium]